MGLEETYLVEQSASRLNELGLVINGRGRIYSNEWEDDKEEEDMELSLYTLLDFGRQITLGMVCGCNYVFSACMSELSPYS
jgi:hypothetical protein